MSVLRPITPDDHARVLDWNESNVSVLAPLDEARLLTLLGWADLGCVICPEGHDVGFVLTFASGTAYDSANYAWFAERGVRLGRVVVDASVRRTGIASRVYDEIEDRARLVAPVMCLEVNLDPPNDPSLAFHRGRGYREVGQDRVTGHLVSLMVKEL